MNHRKAIPANGSRLRARETDFPLLESQVPASPGVIGTETRGYPFLFFHNFLHRERPTFPFQDRLDLSVPDRTFERGVVIFVLVGARDRVSGD
jgi:hypothetical protein